MSKEDMITITLTSEEVGSITFTSSEKITNKINLDNKKYEYFTYENVIKIPVEVAKTLLREITMKLNKGEVK